MDGDYQSPDRTEILRELSQLSQKLDELKEAIRNPQPGRAAEPLEMALDQVQMASVQMLKLTRNLCAVGREHDSCRQFATSIFESTPFALVVTDQESRIHEVNRAASDMFDLDDGKPNPPYLLDRFVDHPRNEVKERLNRLEDRESSLSCRSKVRTGDGTVCEVITHVAPFNPGLESQPRDEFLWMIQDISETHGIGDEEEAKLEQQATLGRMTTGITHEFKNVLGIITTWTELGLREDDCPEPVRNALRKISRAANRAATLSHSILSYGRKESTDPEALEVNELLEENADTLQALLPSGIEMQCESADRPLEFIFDRDHLEQVLLNLVLNARDAISKTGRVTLGASNRTLEEGELDIQRAELPAGRYVDIYVEDTGCGMDGDTLQEASDPFYSTKSEDGGTGLGLPTVYELVQQGNGSVLIDSEPGIGTEVHVLIPLEPSD